MKTTLKILCISLCLILSISTLSSCGLLNNINDGLNMLGNNINAHFDDPCMVYYDSDGLLRVTIDGVPIDHSFEGDVRLVGIRDGAAFFEEKLDGGYNVYGVYNVPPTVRKLNISPVDEIILYNIDSSEFIFKDGDSYYLMDGSEQRLAKVEQQPRDFIFLYHGVVFTALDTDGIRKAYLYRPNSSTVMQEILHEEVTPVAAEGYDPEIIYGVCSDSSEMPCLWVQKWNDYHQVADSQGFVSVNGITEDGEEILFTKKTKSDGGEDKLVTCIYSVNIDRTYVIGDGSLMPLVSERNASKYVKFSDMYFSAEGIGTYYVDKKFNSTYVCEYSERLSYYSEFLYELDDNSLYVCDLDDNSVRNAYTNVKKYELLPSGDAFVLTYDGELYRYDPDKKSSEHISELISESVSDISFLERTNTLYFSKDGEVYTVSGTGRVKLSEFEVLPEFINSSGAYTYAICRTGSGDTASIYYSWFDNHFKLVASDVIPIALGNSEA